MSPDSIPEELSRATVSQQYTRGQKLIGLDILPSNHPEHRRVQLMNSEMVDLLLKLRDNKDNSYEMNLLIGTALSSLLATNSLVLKALNFKQ